MVNLPAGSPGAVVAARLSALTPQSESTAALLGTLCGAAPVARNAELPGTGRLRFLSEGLAARHRLMPDGRRQILTFILPGDVIGDPWSEARRAGSEAAWRAAPPPLLDGEPLVALNAVRVIDGAPLATAIAQAPSDHAGLIEAMLLSRRLEEHWVLNQLVRLGQCSAHERLGHMLLELRDRLAMAGVARHDALPLAPTQAMLAEALGLSIVHLNRVVQLLRRDGLLDVRSGWALLPDPAALERACSYRSPDFITWSSEGASGPVAARLGAR